MNATPSRSDISQARKTSLLILVLILVLVPAIFWALLWGSVRYSFGELFEAVRVLLERTENSGVSNLAALILFEIRLPRLILALAVGASLAVSGAAFQGIFRNSLADPYVIGTSSGAALGACIAIVSGLPQTGTLSPVSLCAFAGALGAVALVFVISRAVGNPPPTVALLLAGTALGTLFSAALSLIQVLRDRDIHRVFYWLQGSLNGTTWPVLPTAVAVMALGCLIVFLSGRNLDLLLQGEEVAESLGVDVKKARFIAALGASLAVAAAVSVTGIIGFVGLIAPHSVRVITGPAHRRLLPAAALAGALILVIADMITRSIAGVELPIGIITSAGGAPFFIYILARYGKNLGRF
ncbi:MAG: iron ABC transporter permease [Spirochaetaceae bacterium]|jgi:iron complex transport system permease protein|nr:iron ABC transporter permease [Spirochaetaceae bacterium]